MVVSADFDRQVRYEAFAYLTKLEEQAGGGPVRYADLRSFEFQGTRIPLVDRQRGIRNPKTMMATLSFKSTPGDGATERDYVDGIGPDGFLRYSWQTGYGADTTNAAVRRAAALQLPLIWLSGIGAGRYEAFRPVYVVDEDPQAQQFVIAFDDLHKATWPVETEAAAEVSRRYVTRAVRQRLHQASFRAMVLSAYREQCAICGLGFAPLLDAAHIAPDRDGGRASVRNGLALCKLHHAAYDGDILGIDGAYRIHLHPRVGAHVDPMGSITLQQMAGRTLRRPPREFLWPDQGLLAERFMRFREAS